METRVHLWKYVSEVFLEWELFQKQSCRESQNTRYAQQRFPENEIMYKNIVQSVSTTQDKLIRHMCLACWVSKATDTSSAYVILITFPCQHWLRERAAIFP
jgi:hypothetical protein